MQATQCSQAQRAFVAKPSTKSSRRSVSVCAQKGAILGALRRRVVSRCRAVSRLAEGPPRFPKSHKSLYRSADFAQSPLQLIAAGLAAVALVHGSPAEAKVVLAKPEVKNFTKAAPAAEKKAKASPAERKAAAAANSGEGISDSFDLKPLTLPLCLGVIAGGTIALGAADPEFFTMMSTASSRNSRLLGVGYESDNGLKETPFFGGTSAIGGGPAGGKVRRRSGGRGGGG